MYATGWGVFIDQAALRTSVMPMRALSFTNSPLYPNTAARRMSSSIK